MLADAILHPDWSIVDPALSTIVLHVHAGMGGSMLARTWHGFISRLPTYSKYQRLASASNTMEFISVHIESRYPTMYIDDLVPYA